jgi:hypothetical protein
MVKLIPRASLRKAHHLANPARTQETVTSPAGERLQDLPPRPHQHLDAISHQLRQELGREPTPKEVRARFQSQLQPMDFGQMLVEGVREMLGPLPEKPPGRWRIFVQRLLHPWRAVPVARPGHRP